MAARRRDFDRIDEFCDHLLVLDHALGDGPQAVVGTYRLLRRSIAQRAGGFYSASEFDLSALDAVQGELLELGRSCVDAAHRTRATMQMLWAGIARYVFEKDIRVMFGCGSLPGTDVATLAPALSYLHHHHLAPSEYRVRALAERYMAMGILPASEVDANAAVRAFDARAVLAGLPPLIKGYLRLGGFVGDGAVIDHEFNTTDVCIIVVTDKLTDKYFRHYTRKLAADPR
jgi:putative hemolysin